MNTPARVVLLALLAVAGAAHAAPPAAETVRVDGDEIALALPDLPGLARAAPEPPRLRVWASKSSESEFVVEVVAHPKEEEGLWDPADALAREEAALRYPGGGGGPDFLFRAQEVLRGPFGQVPFACFGSGPMDDGSGTPGEAFALCGLLSRKAYSVVVRVKGRNPPVFRDMILAFLREGVRVTVRDAEAAWSDGELAVRLDREVPEGCGRAEFGAPSRSPHFVVLSNAAPATAPAFAKRLEAVYATVQKAFPFEEEAGRRPSPVYLFREEAQYRRFLVESRGKPEAWAARPKARAEGDWLATFAGAAGDAAVVHEAARQVLRNRWRVAGGGAWLLEGMASCVSRKPADRKAFAKAALRAGKAVPVEDLLRAADFVAEVGLVKGPDASLQAGSLVEFLKDGPWPREKFAPFVRRAAALPPEATEAFAEALRAAYGADAAGLGAAWAKWAAK